MTASRDIFQVEIRTRDLSRTVPFYRAVFDWKIYKAADDYALVDTGTMPVVAFLQTSDPRFSISAANNLIVEDCAQEAARAVALGGRVSVAKSEVPGSGAYTGVVDPWGNEIFFWQPYTDARPHLRGSGQNPISFMEIAVPNLAAATKYYSELAGWSFWSVVFKDAFAMSEGCGLKRGVGLFAGGGTGITDYVEVGNLEETVAKIQGAGGTILSAPADFPGEGRYILFEDLDGVRMGAIEQPRS
jgi:predicted enzyme related to lactoylglutathione lyase